ncbi:hypothetical protein MRB53_020216 [Persea americana]|uniref:Uncharacterized protein n=1 Tax=Persea americana TaxID=3435 RepID=A0ACC2L1I9_PERAE|nr:hypothetical protein MRB53_020216 [Persea americana]
MPRIVEPADEGDGLRLADRHDPHALVRPSRPLRRLMDAVEHGAERRDDSPFCCLRGHSILVESSRQIGIGFWTADFGETCYKLCGSCWFGFL